MVTHFNTKDMISFGAFLLSKGRREAFEATQSETSGDLEDRIGQVFPADFENWKAFVESKRFHGDECEIKHSTHPRHVRCNCHRKDGKFDLTK